MKVISAICLAASTIIVEARVIVLESLMPRDMERIAVSAAEDAFSSYGDQQGTRVCRYIKQQMDGKFRPEWHCVFGPEL